MATNARDVKIGSMQKQSQYRKQWRRRYFSLANGVLSYSEEEGGPMKDEFDLTAAQIAENYLGRGQEFGIKLRITEPLEDVFLMCDTGKDQEDWMTAFKRQILHANLLSLRSRNPEKISRLDTWWAKIETDYESTIGRLGDVHPLEKYYMNFFNMAAHHERLVYMISTSVRVSNMSGRSNVPAESGLTIVWHPRERDRVPTGEKVPDDVKCIPLRDVADVHSGVTSATVLKGLEGKPEADLCFSVHSRHGKVLAVQTDSQDERDWWVLSIRKIIAYIRALEMREGKAVRNLDVGGTSPASTSTTSSSLSSSRTGSGSGSGGAGGGSTGSGGASDSRSRLRASMQQAAPAAAGPARPIR